jgi:N-acetylglutamate synthase-like GNAT family acetyltransferase
MTFDASSGTPLSAEVHAPFAAIRRATPGDLAGIERLLVASGLPTEGVSSALDGFLVAEEEGRIVGVVGVEARGEYGLLRSTAVTTEWRSRGLGRQLVERAIAEAESRGTKALYLLTTTAERYFPSFGFATTTRDVVPESIQTTGEFRVACPASATVMSLTLVPKSD